MNKQRIRFIINPISGKVRKKNLPEKIAENIDTERFDYEIKYSEYAGHAKILVQEAVAEQFDIVVAAGGDGSINEIGVPLIDTDVALGIIPCGSGNGFSHHVDLPLNAVKAIKVLNEGKRHKIDTVTVNGIPFISIAGTGFDAKIADDYAKDPRRGFDTYMKYIIRNYVTYREQNYKIIMPDQTVETKAMFISFANSNEQGYNIPISPHASLQDGKVDLCVVRKPNPFELPIMGGYMINKKMDKAPKVDIYQTTEARIIREKAEVINIDGESVMTEKDLEIIVKPFSLNIIA